MTPEQHHAEERQRLIEAGKALDALDALDAYTADRYPGIHLDHRHGPWSVQLLHSPGISVTLAQDQGLAAAIVAAAEKVKKLRQRAARHAAWDAMTASAGDEGEVMKEEPGE